MQWQDLPYRPIQGDPKQNTFQVKYTKICVRMKECILFDVCFLQLFLMGVNKKWRASDNRRSPKATREWLVVLCATKAP